MTTTAHDGRERVSAKQARYRADGGRTIDLAITLVLFALALSIGIPAIGRASSDNGADGVDAAAASSGSNAVIDEGTYLLSVTAHDRDIGYPLGSPVMISVSIVDADGVFNGLQQPLQRLPADAWSIEVSTPTRHLRMLGSDGTIELPIAFTPSEIGPHTISLIDRRDGTVISESTIGIQAPSQPQSIASGSNEGADEDGAPENDDDDKDDEDYKTHEDYNSQEGDNTRWNNEPRPEALKSTSDREEFRSAVPDVARKERIMHGPRERSIIAQEWTGDGVTIGLDLIGQDAQEPLNVFVRRQGTAQQRLREPQRMRGNPGAETGLTAESGIGDIVLSNGMMERNGTGNGTYDTIGNVTPSDVEGTVYDIDIDDPIPQVRRLSLRGIRDVRRVLVRIETIEPPIIDDVSVTAAFAIDPSQTGMADGTMTKIATGTSLHKCALWDFDEQTCLGEWVFVTALTPGEEYDIALSPDDPGFAEGVVDIGYPANLDLNDLFALASVPSPMETNSTPWGVVVFNPTNQSVEVTNLTLFARSGTGTGSIFSAIGAVAPQDTWTRPLAYRINWNGSAVIEPYGAQEFIVNVTGPNSNIANIVVHVNVTTNVSNLSTNGYITYSASNTNLPQPTIYLPNSSGGPSYTVNDIGPNSNREYTIRVDNTQSMANISIGTTLLIYVPQGWKNVTAASQSGWSVGTVRGDENGGWIMIPQVTSTPINRGSYLDFAFNATAPDHDRASVHHLRGMLMGPSSTTGTGINSVINAALRVVDDSTPLLNETDGRLAVVSTRGGTQALSQYVTMPAPAGRNAENVWGIVVVNPTNDPVNVTQIDWNSDVGFFNTTIGITDGTWTRPSSSNVRWTGTETIPARGTKEFIMKAKALGNANTVATIAIATQTSAGTITTDNHVTYMRNGNIQYPAMHALNDTDGITLTHEGLTPGQPHNVTIRVNNTGAGSTIPTYTKLEINIPPGWTDITANAQSGWLITNIRSDPRGGGTIDAITYTSTIATNGFRDFNFTATPPASGTNSTYMIDAILYGRTGAIATQTIESKIQLAMNVVPASYGLDVTHLSESMGNASNVTSLIIGSIARATVPTAFNLSIYNTATGDYETVMSDTLGTTDENWNITITLNTTNDPRHYVNQTAGTDGYGRVLVRWQTNSSDTLRLEQDSLTYEMTIDTQAPSLTITPQGNTSSPNVTFTYNASDDHGLQNCTLYLNNTINQTAIAPANGEGEFSIDGISDGDHSWYIACWDFVGKSNISGISYFGVDTQAPSSFTLLTPQNETYSTILQPNLTWEESSDIHFNRYEVIISDSETFNTITATYNVSPQSNTSITTGLLPSDSTLHWTVVAHDAFGNSRNATDTYRYITDTTPPIVDLETPEDNSFVLTSLVTLNYTPYDTNLANCTLWHNASGTFSANATNTTPTNNAQNSFNDTLADGVVLWNVLCTDKAGQTGHDGVNRTVRIDTTPPIVTLISPGNGTYENITNNFAFQYNVTDTMTTVASCSLIIDDIVTANTFTVNEEVTMNFSGFVMNGDHAWSINCTDANGFIGASPTHTLSVNVSEETDPPIIVMNDPYSDTHFAVSNVTFNYTPSDASGIENCSIFIDGGLNATDATITNLQPNTFLVEGISEGFHTWSVDCADNLTFITGTSLTKNFTIDLTDPTVALETPDNNTFVETTTTHYNYTPSDTNFGSCELWDNTSGTFALRSTDTAPENGTVNTFSVENPDGVYIWNVRCIDRSGRAASGTDNRTALVDANAPAFTNEIVSVPSPSVYAPAIEYGFNITIEEPFLDTVYFEHDFNGTMVNETPTAEGMTFVFTTTDLIPGNYTYRWHASDTLGRYNSTIPTGYIIVKANSSINFTVNDSDQDRIVNESGSFNVSARLIEPSGGIVAIYLNGAVFSQGDAPQENITALPDPGVYNLTAIYEENSNYTGDRKTIIIIVNDTTPPDITLVTPEDGSSVGVRNVAFQYIASDYNGVQNCSIYINDTINQTDTTVENATASSFIVALPDGDYAWRIDCSDTMNNTRQSATRTVTVQLSSLIRVMVDANASSYETGETVSIDTNSTDVFSNPIISTVKIDVIQGNTTAGWWNATPWWDAAWERRAPLLITNKRAQALQNTLIEANISGFGGRMDDCIELRIVKRNDSGGIEMPMRIIGGDNSTYCVVQFLADVTGNAVNQSDHHVYYNNSGAGASGLALSALNVQRGNIGGTTGTITATLEKSVNTSKTFVLFTSNTASSNPNAHQYTPDISETQIDFTRYTGGTATNISWQAVEHQDITVQRSATAFAIGETVTNITIEPVNTSRSFIVVYGRANSGTASVTNLGYFMARFVNSSTVELARSASTVAAVASIQVVEWDGAIVRQGDLSFTASSVSVNFTPVNMSNSVLFFNYRMTGATGIGANLISGSLRNNTQAIFNRTQAAGTANLSWFVVEFGTPVVVQTGNRSFTTDTTANIVPVTMDKSFHTQSWTSTGTTSTVYQNTFTKVNLTNTTALIMDKYTATQTLVVNWSVVQLTFNETNTSTGPTESLIASQTANSDASGIVSMAFNTSGLVYGNYTATATANRTNFTTTMNWTIIAIRADNTSPTVELIAPEEGAWHNTTAVFTITAYDTNLANCTLWHNASGTFSANATNTTAMSNANTTMTTSMTEGVVRWNARCEDMYGNAAFASANRTIRVDTTPPNIVLMSPANNSNVSLATTLNWSVTDGLSPNATCMIIRDDVTAQNGILVENDTTASENITLDGGGIHTLSVNCTDANGNTNQSATTSVFNVVAPQSVNISIVGDDIIINWSAASGSDGYSIYISDDYNTGWEEVPNTTVSGSGYIDAGANSGRERYYRISSVRSEAETVRAQAVGRYRVPLAQGLNLVSFPFITNALTLENGTGAGFRFSTDQPCVRALWRYTGTGYQRTDWNGSVFTPAIGSANFKNISMNESYWLETNATCNLTMLGNVPVQNNTRAMKSGRNLLSWGTVQNVTLPTDSQPPLFITTPSNRIETINRYNPDTGTFEVTVHYIVDGTPWGWFPSVENPDFLSMEPSRGYFFNTVGTATWTFDPRTT